jgi:hypothetical protein
MEPTEYYDAPINKAPTLHSRCRIYKGLIKRGSTTDNLRSQCKGWILWPTPYTYITDLNNNTFKNRISTL